jgi:hypothetical protein
LPCGREPITWARTSRSTGGPCWAGEEGCLLYLMACVMGEEKWQVEYPRRRRLGEG